MKSAKRLSNYLCVSQVVALSAIVSLLTAQSEASPWAPSTSAVPVAGPAIPGPAEVPGKDFSHFADRDEFALPAPEQDIAWDGFGGVRNSFNYSTSVRPPLAPLTGPPPPFWEVDAIANGGDALFDALINDQAALLFSVGGAFPGIPSVQGNPPGPGTQVGDGLIYFNAAEGFGPPPVEADYWTDPPTIGGPPFFPLVFQIDNMTLPDDVDGLEVWGGDFSDDTNRYSLRDDPRADLDGDGTPESKVAVWEYDPLGDVSTPHTLTRDLAIAMDLQFGGPGEFGDIFEQLNELMDVDAVMVNEERLIYSIAPLNLGPLTVPGTPLLPDFDGGEIFVYDGPGLPTQFLNQGGYVWDTAFDVVGTFQGLGLLVLSENINALEAVAVPEPSTFALVLLLGMVGCFRRNRR